MIIIKKSCPSNIYLIDDEKNINNTKEHRLSSSSISKTFNNKIVMMRQIIYILDTIVINTIYEGPVLPTLIISIIKKKILPSGQS